jgi:hypothetical protein
MNLKVIEKGNHIKGLFSDLPASTKKKNKLNMPAPVKVALRASLRSGR